MGKKDGSPVVVEEALTVDEGEPSTIVGQQIDTLSEWAPAFPRLRQMIEHAMTYSYDIHGEEEACLRAFLAEISKDR